MELCRADILTLLLGLVIVGIPLVIGGYLLILIVRKLR